MKKLVPAWQGLTVTRKMFVVGATIAIFLAVLGMSRVVSQPRMTLLYAGLDPAAAGEVIQALEQQGAAYDVRGSSVFVAARERDQLRMTLASNGMPASNGQGYELLDQLNGFGTTSRMFDAAYLRAKEGELARTIVSSPEIMSARVHIAAGMEKTFRPDPVPTASAHLTARSGAVSQASANAVRHLVASAVAGLKASDVAIVDAEAGLIPDGDDPVSAATDEKRTAMLRDRVLRLVEARVGHGNAVVEVSVDAVTESEAITERSFDPNSRFVISSDTEERSDQSENAGSGAVTVASNLPDGDANTSETETRQRSETRERINYEVSQTTREVIKSPGAIKRLTVAVLVNGSTTIDATGAQVFEPVPEDELNDLRDLVASAVGFDEARGDVITLKSLSFEAAEAVGTSPVETPWWSTQIDAMSLAQLGILAFVAVILGLFVVRPLLAPKQAGSNLAPLGLPPADATSDKDLPVLNGTIEPDDIDASLPVLASAQMPDGVPSTEDAVTRLKSLIEERRGETVEVLRSWLDDPKPEDMR